MPKQVLRAGDEWDILGSHEYEKGVSKLHSAIKHGPEKDHFQISSSINPNASGTGDLVVYDCPLGSMVELHRMAIWANGFDAGNPYTAGSITFWLNDNSMVNFLPQNGTIAPTVFVEGTGGLIMHGGETLTATFRGLTVPLNVFIQFQRWDSA